MPGWISCGGPAKLFLWYRADNRSFMMYWMNDDTVRWDECVLWIDARQGLLDADTAFVSWDECTWEPVAIAYSDD